MGARGLPGVSLLLPLPIARRSLENERRRESRIIFENRN
jgi:hypothetical protein